MDSLLKILGFVLAAVTAASAALTYQKNARTKAAEFLLSLHKAFFVDTTYSGMKALLDCDTPGDEANLSEVVRAETTEFTDFLNFFELVAYFESIETLSHEDVEALLGYYLDRLSKKVVVRKYVRDSSHSFEHLRLLLTEREAR